jgi:hypothetical protein
MKLNEAIITSGFQPPRLGVEMVEAHLPGGKILVLPVPEDEAP